MMRPGHFRGDLSLLRQGIRVAAGFGFHSVEGLVSVVELLEHSVYEAHSLTIGPSGFSFVLLNPPLRMGAFSAVRLFWNGAAVPADAAFIRPGGTTTAIPFSAVRRETPVTIPIGRRTVFLARPESRSPGRQRVRLELQSVAIPPLVWFEFADVAREEPPGP